jgi:predicted ATPase with chaperone activity
MPVRVWGMAEDRLIEITASSEPEGSGLRVEGLPPRRSRTTADRVRAALINSGMLAEVPAGVLRLEPAVAAGETWELDLPLALALLAEARMVGAGLRWILASGRLGLDGAVSAPGAERLDLAEVVRSCQTPSVASEQMFEEDV